MKTKLLVLGLLAAGVMGLTGCSSQKVPGGKVTSVLGGLWYENTASYQPIPAAGLDNYGDKYWVKGNPTGKEVSLFWGLITYTDY